jgi:hypothetical protein
MKIYHLYTVVLLLLLSSSINAQTKATNQVKTASQKPVQNPLTSASDSISMAVNDIKTSMNGVKTSFNSLFAGKRDTISILIPNIDYDDANLALLKENLKKVKGVKAVLMQYKSATAILEIMFKGKSTALWDELPHESKEPFKLVEANENNITLKYTK